MTEVSLSDGHPFGDQPDREGIRVQFRGEIVAIPVATSLKQLEIHLRERMQPSAESFFHLHPTGINGIGFWRYTSPEERERAAHGSWKNELDDRVAVIPNKPSHSNSPYTVGTIRPDMLLRRLAYFAMPEAIALCKTDTIIIAPSSMPRASYDFSESERKEKIVAELSSAVAIRAPLLFKDGGFYDNDTSSTDGTRMCHAEDMVRFLSRLSPTILSLGITKIRPEQLT